MSMVAGPPPIHMMMTLLFWLRSVWAFAWIVRRNSMPSSGPQLRRRRLGVMHIVFFTVAASAPLTVLGGATANFAVTGITALALAYIIIAVALALFAVGYAAMSRFVANAGAFYSYLAHGLGPTAAVAGAGVALVSYNAIQIGLYGLFGSATAMLLIVSKLRTPSLRAFAALFFRTRAAISASSLVPSWK